MDDDDTYNKGSCGTTVHDATEAATDVEEAEEEDDSWAGFCVDIDSAERQ
jgi:hypothetical protein